MVLGTYLREVRDKRQLSLRDVQRLAKEKNIGAEISSGYLSMLERNAIKQPSPRILHTLAAIYEVDYIELMRKAEYIPNETSLREAPQTNAAFRGAAQLSKEQQRRVQRIIDFELSEARRSKRQRKTGDGDV